MNQKLQELDKKHVDRYEKMQEDYEDKIDIMKQVHEKEKEHQKATSDMQLGKGFKSTSSYLKLYWYVRSHLFHYSSVQESYQHSVSSPDPAAKGEGESRK